MQWQITCCEIEVDKRIFTAVVQGDRDAFGDLFQKYYQVLCNYALTYLDDVSEVEDAVQDVFVYVWNKPGGNCCGYFCEVLIYLLL